MKFRKKNEPKIEVEAVQFHGFVGDGTDAVQQVWPIGWDVSKWYAEPSAANGLPKYLWITPPRVLVRKGDWIVRGQHGAFDVISPQRFPQLFEPVESPQQPPEFERRLIEELRAVHSEVLEALMRAGSKIGDIATHDLKLAVAARVEAERERDRFARLVVAGEAAYCGSAIITAVIGFLEAAGCGKPGTPNTVWSMVQEIIGRAQAAEKRAEEAERLAKLAGTAAYSLESDLSLASNGILMANGRRARAEYALDRSQQREAGLAAALLGVRDFDDGDGKPCWCCDGRSGSRPVHS